MHPHSDTAPTKLVVKGVFYPKGGSEATGEVMYYPIIVNHYQTGVTINGSAAAPTNDSKITKNTIYSLSLTIKGRGTASPSDDISPASASVNVSVAPWDALSKNASEYDPPITLSTATWGTGGGTIPFLPHPNVGEYLFADGTWGTLAANSGKTPIAVIFSATPSNTDKAKGWVHGYAMALQNAPTTNSAETCAWGPVDTDSPEPNFTSDYNTWKSNEDGYTETNLIGSNVNYPAFYYALKFNDVIPPPAGTSGWYLPSNGQWNDIIYTLGGITTSPSVYLSTARVPSGENTAEWSVPSPLNCQTAINVYINNAKTANSSINVDLIDRGDIDSSHILNNWGDYYWTSSEWNSTYSFLAALGYTVGLYLTARIDGKSQLFRVRPVIAF